MDFAINTTFVVDNKRVDAFLKALRREYIVAAQLSGIFDRPHLCQVLTAAEPSTSSFALLLHTQSLEAANLWLSTKGAAIVDAMRSSEPSSVLTFNTEMQLLPL